VSEATGSSKTAALLVEIGCEEIPARFLTAAERQLGEGIEAALQDARLLESGGGVKTGSTPRRLVAYVPALLARQPDRVHEVLGPSAKAAFDEHGRPTRAAEAFAAKQGVQVLELRRIRQAKGEYVVADVRQAGSEGIQVLSELLPHLISTLSFPKSMYWTAKAGPRFVRPIRWILALLGNPEGVRIVPFEFAGVKSGSYTFGHRLKGGEPFEIHDLNLDLKLMQHWVVLRPSDRRQRVRDGIKALLEHRDLAVAPDEFLESWVANSTEWPVPIMGSFDRRYLALPREVLITVMRDHQKYFGLEDRSGVLQPYFITVLNVPGDPKGLVRQGHQRVLAARFADAQFFWNADQKSSLADRIPMLDRVMYHEKLGSYGDKVRRMRVLAGEICGELGTSGALGAREREHALRAVGLCKCDLTTQMVQEFTELQGVMGGLYAKAQGEPEEVANAIYDHYKPIGVEDSCPRSVPGAVVSLADKVDTVVSGFSAGLEPTGSSDPFGLRRAGNGAIKLCLEVLRGLDLYALAAKHAAYVTQALENKGRGELWPRVEEFLCERMEFYLRDVVGLRYDTVRAVLAPAADLQQRPWAPSTALKLAEALDRVRDTDDFLALAAAAKRTRNILSKSAREEDLTRTTPDPALLTEEPEKDLAGAYRTLNEMIESMAAADNYEEAFRAMATIRPQVDRFFDKVLVMTEDELVRKNRLALLIQLNKGLFTRLAQLAEIALPRSS
jgi:glycyl-tRNA synthetase beta chain